MYEGRGGGRRRAPAGRPAGRLASLIVPFDERKRRKATRPESASNADSRWQPSGA
ncbi:unnamed protein product, partial [Strongylus vulgaris]